MGRSTARLWLKQSCSRPSCYERCHLTASSMRASSAFVFASHRLPQLFCALQDLPACCRSLCSKRTHCLCHFLAGLCIHSLVQKQLYIVLSRVPTLLACKSWWVQQGYLQPTSSAESADPYCCSKLRSQRDLQKLTGLSTAIISRYSPVGRFFF